MFVAYSVSAIKPDVKQCAKSADVVVLIESTGPDPENLKSAKEMIKQLGLKLSASLDGAQVNRISSRVKAIFTFSKCEMVEALLNMFCNSRWVLCSFLMKTVASFL